MQLVPSGGVTHSVQERLKTTTITTHRLYCFLVSRTVIRRATPFSISITCVMPPDSQTSLRVQMVKCMFHVFAGSPLMGFSLTEGSGCGVREVVLGGPF